MPEIVGQAPLLKLFSKHLPKVTLLIGPRGHGKRTLVKTLVKDHYYFNLFIPESLKVDDMREIIEDSYALSHPRLHLLADADDMTIPAQNALLKVIENPPPHAYFFFTAQNEDKILPTIRSRCVILKMANYTPETLAFFTDDKTLLQVCENPGQILRLSESPDVVALAKKVVENIDKISAANTFNILRHMNPDDYDIFLLALRGAYREHIIKSHDFRYVEQVRIVAQHQKYFSNKSISKPSLMEVLLIRLRQVAIGGAI